MARKTITITIDLEGAALAEDFGDMEAHELLRTAANDVRSLHDSTGWLPGRSYPIIDSNGNRVGEMAVTER